MLELQIDRAVRSALSPARWAELRRQARRMVRAVGLTEGGPELEVALRLTGDDEIWALNKRYRRKDRPTDVLAFAQRERRAGPAAPVAVIDRAVLGDVVISVATARRQARRGLGRELGFLFAHGLCHLIGYDHRTDREERRMNARMAALLAEASRRGRVRPA